MPVVDNSELRKSQCTQLEFDINKVVKFFDRKKTMEKLENADDQPFLHFQQIFQKASSTVWLTLSQRTNFRLLQTERVCKRQFQI